MTHKRLLALALFSLLTGCELFTPGPESTTELSVMSVTPAPGATDVPLETRVEAELELGGTDLNLLTLTDTTVQLSSPAGAVAAERNLEGDTLVLIPSSPLTGATTYTFSVMSGLQNADGVGVEPFTSSFTTVAAETPDPTDPTDPGEPTDPEPGDGIAGLTMINSLRAPSPDRMVLSKIGTIGKPCEGSDSPDCNENRWQNLSSRDTGEVLLRNEGASPLTLTLSSSAPEVYTVTPSSVTVAPGASARAEVVFAGTYPGKGVYEALIDAVAGSERASLALYGVYQPVPERGDEPSLSQILRAFGYETTLGDHRSNASDSPPAGSEVRSRLWQKANPNADIVVTELAAFKTCCFPNEQNLTDFELFADGEPEYFFQLQYDPNYAQSIYPTGAEGAVPNRGTTDFDGPFRIQVDRYSSKNPGESGLLGLRLWPVTGRANTYIVGQDYALAACGAAPEEGDNGLTANCDYQDHVYLVENIEPVAP